MSSLKVNNLTRAGGSGVPDLGGVAANRLLPTAWVNFNGAGVVAIRDSYNVSSITDVGAGVWAVNFTTPMNNANYCVAGTASDADGAGNETVLFPITGAFLTSSIRVRASTGGGVAFDSPDVSIIIFGGQA